MTQFVQKSKKKIFWLFDPRGWPYDVIRMECAQKRVKDILDVGLTYMVRKVLSRAIFWQIFSKILRLKLEQYQKGSFLTPKIPHISSPRFFFQNRARLLFIKLPEESLCKKSKKSLEPFNVTFVHRLTNQLTNNTGRSSTEVENCNVLERTCSTSVTSLACLTFYCPINLTSFNCK